MSAPRGPARSGARCLARVRPVILSRSAPLPSSGDAHSSPNILIHAARTSGPPEATVVPAATHIPAHAERRQAGCNGRRHGAESGAASGSVPRPGAETGAEAGPLQSAPNTAPAEADVEQLQTRQCVQIRAGRVAERPTSALGRLLEPNMTPPTSGSGRILAGDQQTEVADFNSAEFKQIERFICFNNELIR